MVGPDFKGVKMIPPGVHFVSSNAVSRGTTQGSSDVAPTVSNFVEVALRQVVIRRWNKEEELLLPLEDADEVRLHGRDDTLQKHQPAHILSTWEYQYGPVLRISWRFDSVGVACGVARIRLPD